MTTKYIDSIDIDAPGFPRDEVDSRELVNEWMSGHALAAFVLAKMNETGYSEGELTAEDWGWHLWARDPDGKIAVEVRFSSYGKKEHPNGFLITVEPKSPARHKFFLFREVVMSEAERLSACVYVILSEIKGIVIREARFNEA